jgi:hypothetical protein
MKLDAAEKRLTSQEQEKSQIIEALQMDIKELQEVGPLKDAEIKLVRVSMSRSRAAAATVNRTGVITCLAEELLADVQLSSCQEDDACLPLLRCASFASNHHDAQAELEQKTLLLQSISNKINPGMSKALTNHEDAADGKSSHKKRKRDKSSGHHDKSDDASGRKAARSKCAFLEQLHAICVFAHALRAGRV